MKKGTKLVALLLGLALMVPACTPGANPSKSSQDPGTSSEAPVNYKVTISNKEELQAEWFVGDPSRKVNIEVEPKANITQLVNEGKIQITSSDPAKLAVEGQMASPVAAGEATITVKCGESEDTVKVTLQAKQTVKEKYGVNHEGTAEDPFDNEDACKVAKHEKYNNEDFYVKGKVSSFYYAPGSRTSGEVAFYLTPAEGKTEKFEVFKCFKDKEQKQPLTDDDIWVGGEVTAHGPFTVYNNTQAETSSAIFVKCEGTKPQPRQTLTKTFAEVLAVGNALQDSDSTWDYYKFQGYVTVKSGNDYFLTATKGEALVPGKSDKDHGERDIKGTNAIELYGAGKVEALAAKLLEGAKVEVTMIVKNYHGTIENGLDLKDEDVTVLEAGQPWAIPTVKKTVAEALTIVNGLENGKTTNETYEIEGYIVKVTYAWSADSKNLSFTLGASASATEVLTVYKSGAASGTDGSKLKAGDKVKVVGNLQKYVKGDAVTPEVVNPETTLLEAATEQEIQDVTDVDAVATAKTVAEIKASAANDKIIAKVTGVAENNYGQAKYGNFYLVDPTTGDAIVIYGGYTDATFQKAQDGTFSTKTKKTAITSAIIGHTVTVYGTVGAHNGAGQLVDALVVAGDAYTGNVNVTATANDAAMGTAAVSATSVAYGAEVTVTPTPASGYQVAKVEVKRASKTEEIQAVEGVYKFNAQIKNEVIVTFEEVPAAGVAKATMKYSGTSNSSAEKFAGDALTEALGLDKTIFTVTYSKGEPSSNMALRTDGIRMYGVAGKVNGNSFTVTAASGYSIKSIKIAFDTNYSECAVIKAGDTAVTAADDVYTIGGSAFTVLNDNTGKTNNTQVRFQNIEITYEQVSA